MTAISGGVP